MKVGSKLENWLFTYHNATYKTDNTALKYLLFLLIGTTTLSCFPKQPGPCYDCQLVQTIQVTNQTVSTSSSSYHEICDSLEAQQFITRNTLTRVVPVGVINQQQVNKMISYFATCSK